MKLLENWPVPGADGKPGDPKRGGPTMALYEVSPHHQRPFVEERALFAALHFDPDGQDGYLSDREMRGVNLLIIEQGKRLIAREVALHAVTLASQTGKVSDALVAAIQSKLAREPAEVLASVEPKP